MIEIDHLGLFIVAGLVLNLTPGPDVLYIVSQALCGGVRPGLVAALGITTGCFVHVATAALGVGAVLATSAMAFNVLKWAGAAYLLWMGLRMLWHRILFDSAGSSLAVADNSAMTLKSVFVSGFVTNVFNPKVALFFLAFVPQFIPAHAAEPALTFVVLGGLFNINGMLVCMAWALAASWLAQRARIVQQGMHWLDRLAGVLFVGFAFKLAFTDAPAR